MCFIDRWTSMRAFHFLYRKNHQESAHRCKYIIRRYCGIYVIDKLTWLFLGIYWIYLVGCLFKDYTGEQVTAENFYAVILGDKSSVKGGSGKVVNSKPGDRIFIYYSDHGGPGVLGELIDSISKPFFPV